MGTDIHGWVEVKEPGSWTWKAAFDILEFELPEPVIKTWRGLFRNYGMFSFLFGMRNNEFHFLPVFPFPRALPVNVSYKVKTEIERWGDFGWYSSHECCWFTFSEAQKIDWNAKGTGRVMHEYQKVDGELEHIQGGYIDLEPDLTDQEIEELHKQGFLDRGTNVIKLEPITGNDVFGSDWQELFRLMEELASIHGSENVRVIIWFDS